MISARHLTLLMSLALAACSAVGARAGEAVWQWSVPVGEGRAFLWIPEKCNQLRGVVLAQHNMIEQGVLEHAALRSTLAELDFGEVFVAPPFDRPFDFSRGAGERFGQFMDQLAAVSGYDELTRVPVAPLGHSACASFPWNFAAWAPTRTLAIISLKGDAPLTDLTGSGAPNPPWDGDRLNGIPGLMVMSEQEWWEARLTPLERFRALHPAVPLAVLCDTGHGHFDASDELVRFVALFLRKAARARLAPGTLALQPIDPGQGHPARRWRANGAAADETFWCFDEEMANLTEEIHRRSAGRRDQQVDFFEAGSPVPISTSHTGVELKFEPESDGFTFRLAADFIVPLPRRAPVAAKDRPPPQTTTQPQAAAAGTHGTGSVTVTRIVGPIEPAGVGVFRVALNRTSMAGDRRALDVWLLASHPGDANHKGAVQQALLRLPAGAEGVPQVITFAPPTELAAGTQQIRLDAQSDAGLPVRFYVREGPAYVRDGSLQITPVPPRSKWPVKITVVAWQLGRTAEPRVRAAAPVEQTLLLRQAPACSTSGEARPAEHPAATRAVQP